MSEPESGEIEAAEQPSLEERCAALEQELKFCRASLAAQALKFDALEKATRDADDTERARKNVPADMSRAAQASYQRASSALLDVAIELANEKTGLPLALGDLHALTERQMLLFDALILLLVDRGVVTPLEWWKRRRRTSPM